MSWSEDRARMRIRKFIDNVPQGEIKVENFRAFLAETRSRKGMLVEASTRAALVDIPRNRAITTDGVHIYANLLDFNSVLTEAEQETEASHRRALEFLHAHYRGCDQLIDELSSTKEDAR